MVADSSERPVGTAGEWGHQIVRQVHVRVRKCLWGGVGWGVRERAYRRGWRACGCALRFGASGPAERHAPQLRLILIPILCTCTAAPHRWHHAMPPVACTAVRRDAEASAWDAYPGLSSRCTWRRTREPRSGRTRTLPAGHCRGCLRASPPGRLPPGSVHVRLVAMRMSMLRRPFRPQQRPRPRPRRWAAQRAAGGQGAANHVMWVAR